MKILSVLTFFFSFQAFATSYLLYPMQSNSIEQKLKREKIKTVPVFNQHEKKIYQGMGLPLNALRIETDKTPQQIRQILGNQDYKLELNSTAKMQAEPLEPEQWALFNSGSPLMERTSDIDVNLIQAVKGEDLNLRGIKERDEKILVAVVDSGIDINHPDLKANIYTNQKECEALELFDQCMKDEKDKNICYNKWSNYDSDGNGHPMDCNGWNVAGTALKLSRAQGNHKIVDNIGHGTHIAGIIGAVSDNGIGIRGALKNVTILPVQVNGAIDQRELAANETATDLIAKGVLYAIKTKARIINLSLGWSLSEDSLLMRKVVELAQKEKVLIVAAAGNSAHADPTYPCSYDYVVCAAAHTVNGQLASYSNYGTSVDVIAPGDNILSTWPMGMRPRKYTEGAGYEYQNGTSFASPYVAASLAILLNQGMDTDEALVKLYSGARPIKGKQNFSRQGNVDIAAALDAQVKSYIYPLNKSPYLIQWIKGAPRSFNLRLKNLWKSAQNVQLEIIPVKNFSQQSIHMIENQFAVVNWDKDEEKTFKVAFTSDDDIDSDIYFKLKIKSPHQSKEYYVHTQALTIVTPEFDNNSIHLPIAENNFLNNAILRPFTIFDSNHSVTDFLALKKNAGETYLALVKNQGSNYTVSNPIKFNIKNPVILHLSRVDIDKDGTSEYVLAAVDVDEQAENNLRKTQFFIFDQQMKPSKLVISKDNVYDNKITVMPGSFIWISVKGRMVPAWINMGERPEHERPTPSPWEPTTFESRLYRVYYLTADRLNTFAMKGDETQAVGFLETPVQDRYLGQPVLIVSDKLGFQKNYSLYQIKGQLIKLQEIKLNTYQNLQGIRPLPLNSSLDSYNASFNSIHSLGNQRITNFEWSAGKLKVAHHNLQSFDSYFPIFNVLTYFPEGIFYQTQYHVGFYNNHTGAHHVVPAKVRPDRKLHTAIGKNNALFLASEHTPSLSSEVLSVANDQLNSQRTIYRSSLWRMLGAKGCEMIQFIRERDNDYLFFLCAEQSKFIKIQY